MLGEPETDTEKMRAELLAHHRFLDGEVVARLTGQEFQKADTPLVDRVTRWYDENRFTTVSVPHVGFVSLDRRAVGRSIGHGLNRAKSAAFAAVPRVLSRGRIIYQEPMRDSAEGRVYHLAAPIEIGAEVYVMVVLVKSDHNATRMYTHEVVGKKKLRQSDYQSGDAPPDEQSSDPHSSDAGAVRRVLQRIYSVKEERGVKSHLGNLREP